MPDGPAIGAPLTLDELVNEGLARLMRASGLQPEAPTRELLAPVQYCMDQARSACSGDGWTKLANRLDLTHLETLAGALALRCEWDERTADGVRRLQSTGLGEGAARPTIGLIAHLWVALDRQAQHAEARLAALLCAGNAITSGALLLGRGDVLASGRTVAVHPALIAPLLDAHLGAAREASFGDLDVCCIDPPKWLLPRSWRTAVHRIAEELSLDPGLRVVVRCHDIGEARGLAALIAAELGCAAAEMPLVAHWPLGLQPWLIARGALPVMVCEFAPDERISLPAAKKIPLIAAAGIEGDVVCSSGGTLREWRPGLPSAAERVEIVTQIVPDSDVAAWLSQNWRAGVAVLHSAVESARTLARARGTSPTLDDARAAVSAHGQQLASSFGTLARMMTTEADGTVLVASPTLRRDLDTLRARCLHRETLADVLGVAARARARTGVTALLVGPSGTGKTLGAQWLAGVLSKPLLRVDAAGVTSKYIGETEKNLARLLAKAEQHDCVLLFDEADALFGSRTEVKQSNDRFANAQTNYLLTRIESFGGIAILTSNSKARFDDAFMRRLDAVIDFPLPDAHERAALWRAHLGGQRPGEEVINLIAAEAELAGGYIRNAAITATLLAYERGAGPSVAYSDLLAGIADEYRKLGRRVPDALARH